MSINNNIIDIQKCVSVEKKQSIFESQNKNLADSINKFITGNSLEYLKKLPVGCIDLVIIDPPYNIGYDYNIFKDKVEHEIYIQEQVELLKEIERILTTNGSVYYLNYPETSALIYSELHYNFKKLKPVDIIAWTYNSHSTGKAFRKSYRNWVIASKGQPKIDFTCEYINQDDKRVKKLMAQGKKPSERDVWSGIEQVKNVTKKKHGLDWHPCVLPEEMIRKIILGASEVDQLVVDPYGGGGTTAKVALELGRNFISIELDPLYSQKAKERVYGTSIVNAVA